MLVEDMEEDVADEVEDVEDEVEDSMIPIRKRLNQDVDEDTFSYKMAKLAEEEENAKHVLKLKIGTYLSVNFASFSS